MKWNKRGLDKRYSQEWERQQAEIRLLTEFHQAGRNFGEGFSVDDLLKEFKLGDNHD